jgi:hypothetical protein
MNLVGLFETSTLQNRHADLVTSQFACQKKARHAGADDGNVGGNISAAVSLLCEIGDHTLTSNVASGTCR